MGTRHVTVVVSNKKVKVAQYGQWDGYLSGQGKTIVEFIKDKMNFKTFQKSVNNCVFIDEVKAKQYWTEAGADPNSDLVSFEIADVHKRNHPQLSRDVGAKVLELIQNTDGKGLELRDDLDFVCDSLMCEFAYVLDLDKKVLEIYKGFNKEKPKGRFAKLKNEDEYSSKIGYNPVTLIKKFKFEDCNWKNLKAFEKKFYKEDEE